MRNSKQLGAVVLFVGVFVIADAAACWALSCGDTITVDTVMTADLVCTNQIGLTVEGPATLDLNGHNITCAYAGLLTERGIEVHGNKAVIRNGSVTGCTTGLAAGVFLGGGGHTVENVRVNASLKGFWVNSSHNKLYNNVAETCDYGFYVDYPSNKLLGNAAVKGTVGFEISYPRVVLKDNQAVNNTLGFELTGPSNEGRNTWIGNIATGGSNSGFSLEHGSGNRLIKNVAVGNDGGAGFVIDVGSDGNKLSGNATMGNEYGILVRGSENRVQKNVANGSYDSGIDSGGTGNVFDRNVVAGNLDVDLYDNDGCLSNVWSRNDFGSASDPCMQ